MSFGSFTALEPLPLPEGVRSRTVDGVNGLSMHVLESGFDAPERPCVLLLHGFPELAFSWRRILLPLADAGFHVVAPDQRGYGRTTGWDPDFAAELTPFSFPNLVRDVNALVGALGRASVACVVGHDFGSPVAGWCALMHPEIYRSVVLMSAPFPGAPEPSANPPSERMRALDAALARLDPPRKHYQSYFSSPDANEHLLHAPQGLRALLRAYFHAKSADWRGNRPEPLSTGGEGAARAAGTAETLARLPEYYVMRRERTMAETVAALAPDAEAAARCAWLTEPELAVYVREFARSGFQGGLDWYRCATGGVGADTLAAYAGRTIDVPAAFIAGRQDWGIYQAPGAFERMCSRLTRFAGAYLIDDAGHWVQQEQPGAVVGRLVDFLKTEREAR